MRASKVISVLLILILMLSCFSCQPNNDDFVEKGDGSGQSNGKTVYVYNASVKTFHRENCSYALGIQEIYKKTYDGDPVALIESEGFRFCGICCPEESALYNPKPDSGEGNGITKEEASYALNVGTKKIHNVDCEHAADMTNPNLEYTTLSINELIYKGYAICQVCHPE